MLLQLKPVLNLQDLVWVQLYFVKVIPIDKWTRRSIIPFPISSTWHLLFGSKNLPKRPKKTILPNEFNVQSILHLLKIVRWILHCDLCALLVTKIVLVHVFEQSAAYSKSLVSWQNNKLWYSQLVSIFPCFRSIRFTTRLRILIFLLLICCGIRNKLKRIIF